MAEMVMRVDTPQEREAILKAVRFESPDYIPMFFHINGACWQSYPQEFLFEQMAAHPLLFPGFQAPSEPLKPDFSGSVACAAEPFTDSWGCVWETSTDGITGSVHRHPLADEAAIESFAPPDPATHAHLGPVDWNAVERNLRERREKGLLAIGGLEHGHTFLRLIDLRGYDNLLMDMMDDEPWLEKLVGMVEAFNLELVQRSLKAGVEYMMYPEDLGMQIGPMISPNLFQQYIKPSYERIMKPARDAGVIVHMHSDGDIRTLADDLVEGGVQVINLQDLCNGIDWIANKFGGKTCVDLDIDRQKITALGTPEQIDALIQEEVSKVGRKEGGLTMLYGLYPGVPHENVVALMDAMERYMGYYSH